MENINEPVSIDVFTRNEAVYNTLKGAWLLFLFLLMMVIKTLTISIHSGLAIKLLDIFKNQWCWYRI